MLSDAVGSPKHPISELNTQPADTPVQRFKCSITAALTWLGARVVRYSFPVRLFHSLLYAGLSRRYPDLGVRPTGPHFDEVRFAIVVPEATQTFETQGVCCASHSTAERSASAVMR